MAYVFETCASLGEGAACDDGNGCDTGDVCAAGRCRAGGSTVVCGDDVPRCHVPGCDPSTGGCHERFASFGDPCFRPDEQCSRPDVCDNFGACVLDPDPDPDRDRVCSFDDTCPNVADPGQEDADQDSEGDVCDRTDAALVVQDATVRASVRPSNGKLKVRGELLSRADHSPFDPGEGLIVRVEDTASSFAQVFVWVDSECDGSAPARARCRHAESPKSRIDFRPLARQTDGFVVYRFALVADGLEVEGLPAGPLEVTMTSQPPRAGSGFDRAGLIDGCRPSGTRVRCRISAGAP
jgi:hypothetical protein